MQPDPLTHTSPLLSLWLSMQLKATNRLKRMVVNGATTQELLNTKEVALRTFAQLAIAFGILSFIGALLYFQEMKVEVLLVDTILLIAGGLSFWVAKQYKAFARELQPPLPREIEMTNIQIDESSKLVPLGCEERDVMEKWELETICVDSPSAQEAERPLKDSVRALYVLEGNGSIKIEHNYCAIHKGHFLTLPSMDNHAILRAQQIAVLVQYEQQEENAPPNLFTTTSFDNLRNSSALIKIENGIEKITFPSSSPDRGVEKMTLPQKAASYQWIEVHIPPGGRWQDVTVYQPTFLYILEGSGTLDLEDDDPCSFEVRNSKEIQEDDTFSVHNTGTGVVKVLLIQKP